MAVVHLSLYGHVETGWLFLNDQTFGVFFTNKLRFGTYDMKCMLVRPRILYRISRIPNNKPPCYANPHYLTAIKPNNMNPLTIKQIEQIAKENNVNFDMDEVYRLPMVFSEGIVLRASIQYEDKFDGWKMSDIKRKTAIQLLKMSKIKEILNGNSGK